MSSRLPERIDPARLVQQGKTLAGRYDLAQLPRLAALLEDAGGVVRFEFEFGRDTANRPIVQSQVSADLRLICQRCLGPLEYRIDSRNTLGLVTGLDEAQSLPEEYESLLVGEPAVSLRDMVEEELLLGIPAFPKHDLSCLPEAGASVEKGLASSTSPFSALGALKDGNGKTDF